MKASLLASISAAALLALAGGAGAADLPEEMAPIVAPEIIAYNWSGAYLGGHAGLALRNNGPDDICNSLVGGTDKFGAELDEEALECVEDEETGNRFVDLGGTSSDKVGIGFPGGGEDDDEELAFIGGAQVGYNWQVGRGVFGIETDASFTNVGSSNTQDFEVYDKVGIDPAVVGFGEIEEKVDLDWMATLRGRAGVTLGEQGRLLLFGTAGIGVADIEVSLDGSFENGAECSCGFIEDDEDDNVDVGFVVGAGAEYAVTNHVRLGFEYLYANFGEEDAQITILGADDSELTIEKDFDLDFHSLRAKVNFNF